MQKESSVARWSEAEQSCTGSVPKVEPWDFIVCISIDEVYSYAACQGGCVYDSIQRQNTVKATIAGRAEQIAGTECNGNAAWKESTFPDTVRLFFFKHLYYCTLKT